MSVKHIWTREEITKILLNTKKEKNLTYQHLAEKIGRDKVWLACALHGNATMDENEIKTLCGMLSLTDNTEDFSLILKEPPLRHPPDGFKGVCADPTIYRLYEFVNVYGEALKALIHEECGDGIMSAIGLQVNFEVKKKDNEDQMWSLLLMENSYLIKNGK